MAAILKHWREAATLLLVAKSRQPVPSTMQTTNFELLMLKRSGKSRFMPKLHVFPGGVAHDSDFSSEWMDLFGKCGDIGNQHLQSFLHRGGVGPPMFSRTRPEQFSKVPSELAFRICAIRETFEESGILLVRDVNRLKNEPITESLQPVSGKSSILSDVIVSPWRDKVNDDASQFITMCRELDVLPDVWSLYEWSNWLTPILPKSGPEKDQGRRYDTAFYICVLDYTPNAIHCDKETTELEWLSASNFLLKHQDPNVPMTLAPPQIIELGRILNFTDVDKLKKFSWERSRVRVEQWLPVVCRCDDGILFIYPGDELYPDKPDYDGDQEFMYRPGTLSDLRARYPIMNRSEIVLGAKQKGHNPPRTFLCNLDKMADGQVSPLFSFGMDTAATSKL